MWCAAEVSLFEIPKTCKQLKADGSAIRAEIAQLPRLEETLQLDAYGYHGGYLPLLDSLPEQPRWTLELRFKPYISLSQVILVPAIDHRFGLSGSYGFPKRFRVLSVDDEGAVEVVKEWMDSDCPDPGRFPLILDVVQPKARTVLIEVFSGCEDGGREVFALDELFGVMGATAHQCDKVIAGSEYASPPYWDKEYLIDQKTSLGLPLDVRREALPKNEAPDFSVVFDAQPPNGCVIEVDLGMNQRLGWVTLFPAQAPDGILIPGYGFPGDVRMEIVRESESGQRDRIRPLPKKWGRLRPGNNAVRLQGSDMAGRWLRIYIKDLPLHNGQPTFAMGEIHVSRLQETYPIKAVALEGFPAGAEAGAGLMMDGESDGLPVMFLLDWLDRIEERNHLSSTLAELVEVEKALQFRWKQFWQITGLSLVLLLVLGALSVAVLAVVQRKKALKNLKWRIARDLHDEVGSNLGSIALTAERLECDVRDENSREDLIDLLLLAREASASLRDVVWVIDQTSIRLPNLIQKMKERAERVLSGIELVVEMPADCPDREVSLTFKRHLIMFFKEVVHNCARHSGATKVQIAFSVSSDQFKLLVQDDGCGFNPDEIRDGWGLESMQKRAKELGGEMTMESAPGKGTTTALTVPLCALLKQTDHLYKTSN
ncbi:Sensor histidine kinase LiaS [Pontiella sulfatireligans]|uniref:Sensor histidine kinase LiaS n=2 Tax=Pontiella sulfatireligans TaxID=2750658 RepID=A0A6C2UKE7_9BACT|nr:Sensor histidine kinase LiaS [Pontiella sulfatireligans]